MSLADLINQDNYDWMKVDYSERILNIENRIEVISQEIKEVVIRKGEWIKWLDDMSKLVDMNIFDRTTIVRLVSKIYIIRKGKYKIVFSKVINI